MNARDGPAEYRMSIPQHTTYSDSVRSTTHHVGSKVSIDKLRQWTRHDMDEALFNSQAREDQPNWKPWQERLHVLLDPDEPGVLACHGQPESVFPGCEFVRTCHVIGFGAKEDCQKFVFRAFCGCPLSAQGEKTILCVYKMKWGSKKKGYCSMCDKDCTNMQEIYFHCVECKEFMCAPCHNNVDLHPKKRTMLKSSKQIGTDV